MRRLKKEAGRSSKRARRLEHLVDEHKEYELQASEDDFQKFKPRCSVCNFAVEIIEMGAGEMHICENHKECGHRQFLKRKK